jgi:hypothetical protein
MKIAVVSAKARFTTASACELRERSGVGMTNADE